MNPSFVGTNLLTTRTTPLSGIGESPLSFQEWRSAQSKISKDVSHTDYQRYLREWFDVKQSQTQDFRVGLRKRYLDMVDQLRLYFSKSDVEEWFTKISTANDRELAISIPYFAKKLRDIALQYLRLRKEASQTTIKYSFAGTTAGLEKNLRDQILESFTTKGDDSVLYASANWSNLPALSAIAQTLKVTVSELYDDQPYLGRSVTIPSSAYFGMDDQSNIDLFQSKGMDLSASAWVFDTTVGPVSSTFDGLGAAAEDVYASFVAKYLGLDKKIVQQIVPQATTQVFEWAIDAGDNFFYYPDKGSVDPQEFSGGALLPVSLSSVNFDGATAGNSLADSDVMIVRHGEVSKSAWLNNRSTEKVPYNMEASLKSDGASVFVYPFPGYGLSGNNVPWTEPSLTFTAGYPFLDRDTKKAISDLYWEFDFGRYTSVPLRLAESTLVQSGATAATHVTWADRVFISNALSPQEIQSDPDKRGAWLYRLDRALIPIRGESTTQFIWPYGTDRVVSVSAVPSDMSDVCTNIHIGSVDHTKCAASTTPSSADKIYKLDKVSGLVTECAWLSAAPKTNGDVRFDGQPGFSALFTAGEQTHFVWTGADSTPLNAAFAPQHHATDCPFRSETDYRKFETCTCAQIHHTPFGHPGIRFRDNGSMADFVAEDTTSGEDFDIDSWRDPDEYKYESSSAKFAWFKTIDFIGHRYGGWTKGSGTPTDFVLRTGRRYVYRRVGAKAGTQHPSYVTFNTTSPYTAVWAEGKVGDGGVVESTGNASRMLLVPGDVIGYDRAPTTTHIVLSSELVEAEASLRSSIWCNYDIVPIGGDFQVYLSWPVTNYDYAYLNTIDPYQQHPSVAADGLIDIRAWSVTSPSSTTYLSGFSTSFTPSVTGLHYISVTGVNVGGAPIVFSNIPPITAVPQMSAVEVQIPLQCKVPGFLFTADLAGWNYNLNKVGTINNRGGKPYWADIEGGKTAATEHGAVLFSGNANSFIDGYLPDTQPKMSTLELSAGKALRYERQGGTIKWIQKVELGDANIEPQWCTVAVQASSLSNLSAVYGDMVLDTLATALSSPSDIVLTNQIGGDPVEVHYRAVGSFVTTVTANADFTAAQTELVDLVKTDRPWNVFPNRYFPTFAGVPVADQLYEYESVGGFLTPENLGVTIYDNLITVRGLSAGQTAGAETPNIVVGGRGLTKQDQPTSYTTEENNSWIKEPYSTNSLAGNPKRSLTKQHQTFVGYQPEMAVQGIVSPNSLFDPWGGEGDNVWADSKNAPAGFTGVVNVSAWAAAQVLKQSGKRLANWHTDVFGNQYGLYKDAFQCNTPSSRLSATGDMWVRTAGQSVYPASVGLSAVFDSYNIQPLTSIYVALTGNGISDICVAGDTLVVWLSGAVLFERISYDYESDLISSVADNTRAISMQSTPQVGLKRELEGQTSSVLSIASNAWYNSIQNRLVVATACLTGSAIDIQMFALDGEIDNKDRRLVEMYAGGTYLMLSALSAQSVTSCVLTHNGHRTYCCAFGGKDLGGYPYIATAEFSENGKGVDLADIEVCVSDHYFTQKQPPYVMQQSISAVVAVSASQLFLYSLSTVPANNSSMEWELLNYTDLGITISSPGVVRGVVSVPGLYQINFAVSNSDGSTTQTLALSVI